MATIPPAPNTVLEVQLRIHAQREAWAVYSRLIEAYTDSLNKLRAASDWVSHDTITETKFRHAIFSEITRISRLLDMWRNAQAAHDARARMYQSVLDGTRTLEEVELLPVEQMLAQLAVNQRL